MTSSPSRPVARRFAAFLTAFATLLVLGALAPTSALADVVPPYSISGTVTDDTGAPAVGVQVAGLAVPVHRPVVTDAGGHYSVPVPSPARTACTFVPPAGSPLLGEAYDNALPWNPTMFTVGSAGVTGIDAVLDHASSITGRVVDADGDPIAGVSVLLQSVAVRVRLGHHRCGRHVRRHRPAPGRLAHLLPRTAGLAVRRRVLRRRPHAGDADRRRARAGDHRHAERRRARHAVAPSPAASSRPTGRRDPASRCTPRRSRHRRRRHHDRRRRRSTRSPGWPTATTPCRPSRTGATTWWASRTPGRRAGRTPSACTSPVPPPSSSTT